MLIVVVLPAPLGPSRPNSSPFLDGERDVVDGRHVLESFRQVFDSNGVHGNSLS